MNRIVPSILVLSVLTVTIASCVSLPSAVDFEIGVSKSELLAEYGSPSTIRHIVKERGAVFGPIETFWSGLSDGDRVEIWSYGVEGGSVELYFLNETNRVDGTGFAAEGAVY